MHENAYWKSEVIKSLGSEYTDAKAFCDSWVKVVYKAGRLSDADMMLVAVREGDGVVVFAQIGPAMAMGVHAPSFLDVYLDKLGDHAPDFVDGILDKFAELVEQELNDGQPYAILQLKSDSTDKWRSFRAEFGSAQMVGPGELPRRPSYEPSLN